MRWSEDDLKIFLNRSGTGKPGRLPSRPNPPVSTELSENVKAARKELAKAEREVLERKFLAALELAGLPSPKRNRKGIEGREFRFDFCWENYRLAVEIEGTGRGGKRSRHTEPKGYAQDCDKYNLAQLQGWIVLRFSTLHLTDERIGECLNLTEQALKLRSL